MIRFTFDPWAERGQYALEQKLAELSDAEAEAEVYAIEYEDEGDYAKADEWIKKRDAFRREYEEVRRRLDDIMEGW